MTSEQDKTEHKKCRHCLREHNHTTLQICNDCGEPGCMHSLYEITLERTYGVRTVVVYAAKNPRFCPVNRYKPKAFLTKKEA